jgi:hypothetical protein
MGRFRIEKVMTNSGRFFAKLIVAVSAKALNETATGVRLGLT